MDGYLVRKGMKYVMMTAKTDEIAPKFSTFNFQLSIKRVSLPYLSSKTQRVVL